ncbi:MAG TPA: hypothetical protein VFF69_01385, partial [Phycisphaerales bacterium]|nr:hypothetical protein [Phycisphaerales bacterium]
LALDVAGAEVEITKLTTQGELFGQSRAAVQARAQAAQEGAARARGDAEQAAVEIAERVDTGQNALTPFREQQVAPAAEQAMSQFETAANSAKLGTSARRSNAQLALGQAQQSLGDAHWTRALGLDTYAQLMGELAAAEPPLPSAAEYASRAEQARTQANEARQAAYDAYQAAKAAYESTGASGESGALLDQVSVRLNEISRAVGKGVVSDEALSSLEDPESAEADSEDESMDEEQDASQAADAPAGDPAEEIRTLISELAAATESGSYAQVGDVIHPASDADAPIVEQLGDTLAAAERLDQVTADAFGESFTAWAASSAEAQAGQAMSPTAMFDLDPEALDIRVEGDEAMALTGGPGSPELRFRRIDGEWKLLFSAQDMGGGADAMPEAMRQAMAELVPEILTASTKAYTVAAEGVESGSLESNQAVFVTIQSELRSLSQKIMQVMMEAGGGGG